jgi:hypothetical protein
MQKMVGVDVNNGEDDSLVLHSARRCTVSVDVRSSRFVFLPSPRLSTNAMAMRTGFFLPYAGRRNAARCDDPPYGHPRATNYGRSHTERNLPVPSLWQKKFIPLL